jgi:NAD(P)-dependent dehydrogenase (short-subunit alcohol dehydrogenase family)
MSKVILITGTSSGIGFHTAQILAQKGHIVYATARNMHKLDALIAIGCKALQLDVTNEESIRRAVQQILAAERRIDVLINNAGYAQNGFIEEVPVAAWRAQFETNVFGLVRLTQEVLPAMRKQRSGLVLNVGSVVGEFTNPGAVAYHATKYALETITDGMRMELKDFGIRVVLVKPGGVRTQFEDTMSSFYPEPIAGNPYELWRKRFLKVFQEFYAPNSTMGILSAEQVARVIVRAVEARNPRTRYRIGWFANFMPRARYWLGDRRFDTIMLDRLRKAKV